MNFLKLQSLLKHFGDVLKWNGGLVTSDRSGTSIKAKDHLMHITMLITRKWHQWKIVYWCPLLSSPLPSIHRYTFLQGKGYCSLQNFRVSPLGRFTTHIILAFLETIRVAPKGSTKVHTVLQTAAWALIAAGKLDIFTPTFRIVARKPL